MFDELLASLENTITEARSVTALLGSELRESTSGMGKPGCSFFDPMRSLGKATSFPKSERFRVVEKQQPRTTDGYCDLAGNGDEVVGVRGATFAKSQRFIAQKEDELTVLNPNYFVVKPNISQAPKIQLPSMSELQKSRMSQATMASEGEVGPGKYFISEELTKMGKQTPMFSKSKAKRFVKPKPTYEDTPLFVSDAQTRKRPPTMAVLRKKIEKNAKQITNQQQQQLRQKVKLIYWKSIPVELDRLLKKHSTAPLLKDKYFDVKKLRGAQRKCAVMMLLDRLNFERGGYEQKVSKEMGDGPCAVVYRKSTPKPFKFSEAEPGPDFYYPQDDLVRATPVGFTFARGEDRHPQQPDSRDYDINEELFKRGGNVVILPEHKAHRLTEQEIRSLNRGPGFYDCLFSQVEKRSDIGVVKFPQISESNARENNCVDVKQVNDVFYFPSYSAIDPKISVPLYHSPSSVHPRHVADRQLFPQHWLFYDGDLNKVRAQIAKNVLIGNGMQFGEYQLYNKKFKEFQKYMEMQRREAEGLDYAPNYEAVDAHVQGFDMAKQAEKGLLEPIVKPQFGLDGDNLILNPDKPQKKLADVQFGKMVGRDQDELGPDEQLPGDVLLISPKKPEKHIPAVSFQKMVARPQPPSRNDDQDPPEGDRVLIDPKLPANKIAKVDFGRQVGREGVEELLRKREENEELILEPKQEKRVKGFVEMERMSSVRLVPFLRKKREEKISVIRVRSKEKMNGVNGDQENNQ